MSHLPLSETTVQHLRRQNWTEIRIGELAVRKAADPNLDLAREVMLEAMADGLRRKHPGSIIEIVRDNEGRA